MFIQVGPVEEAESVFVVGKVRWDPIQDDADPSLVEVVDEIHQVLRSAVAPGWGKVAGDLVPPGTEEGVVHDREQFHVGKVHLLDIVGQLGGQLAITEGPVPLIHDPHPGAQVQFVDAHRGPKAVACSAALHPSLVLPTIVQIPDDGSGLRRDFVE